MDKLQRLMDLCSAEIYLSINSHRNSYQDVYTYMEDQFHDYIAEIPSHTYQAMVDSDTIVEIHFYPRTPIGFLKVFAADLDDALTTALSCFEGEDKESA